MARLRIQIDCTDRSGAILYLDPEEVLRGLSDAQRDAVLTVVDGAIGDAAWVAGISRERAAEALLAELALRLTDEQAYEREATRRGVLAL